MKENKKVKLAGSSPATALPLFLVFFSWFKKRRV
jgi:hypothetical protein